MSILFFKNNINKNIIKLYEIVKYDVLCFFRYKTNLIWLIATPLVFTMTGVLLALMFGQDSFSEIVGGNTSGPIFVLVGYLIFSFANQGWQINTKIERELSLGTLQNNFLLPIKKHLFIYGLCLGTMFSSGIFNGLILIFVFMIKGTSFVSILAGCGLYCLITAVYLGISLIMAGFTLRTKKLGSLTNIVTFILQFINGMIIPLRVFPASVRSVLQFLPTSLTIDTFRSFTLELEPLTSIHYQMLIMLTYAVIFNVMGIRLIDHSVKQMKIKGGLELY